MDVAELMKKRANITNENIKSQGVLITEKQIEILARRLLPEIKKFFADENIKKEFEEWKAKRQTENVK